ncbi:MAG TPA: NADH-quinone oxidoreductase subunit NuoE [Firmicutes bacterium]|jgi:NADH-quinone oxidoreductase E subunit|nr:NADH-quinone oxidoreductase subunit NuoE [Bacillota bacterium]HHT41868.1 NADH-quinone oxidoreductase subunit NuoE [Bacillota bacterium]
MGCPCGHDGSGLERYLQPLQEVLAKYPSEERYLVPILQDAQEAYGYLPQEVLREVAVKLNISFSKVYGVATFYTQFHLQPRGKNVIKVCTGTACHVRGAGEVLKAIEEELGIQSGQTTPDLEFTLETVACIGACGLAPVIMINDDTHGRLTKSSVKTVLEGYKNQSGGGVVA